MRAVSGKTVGIIAGHMGYDSGAVCEDGLQETQITQAVARLLAERLTLNATLGDLSAHYYKSQAISLNMQESSGLLKAMAEAGFTLEDLT